MSPEARLVAALATAETLVGTDDLRDMPWALGLAAKQHQVDLEALTVLFLRRRRARDVARMAVAKMQPEPDETPGGADQK
jgi:hypothetical protein